MNNLELPKAELRSNGDYYLNFNFPMRAAYGKPNDFMNICSDIINFACDLIYLFIQQLYPKAYPLYALTNGWQN